MTLDEIAADDDEDDGDEDTREILGALKRGDISVDDAVEML